MALPTRMKRWDVVVVGEIYADHVFSGFTAWPAPGEEVVAERYTRDLGGGSVNTACGLSRLGRHTHLVGLIGDVDADWFRRRLAEYGVGMEGIRPTGDGTGITVSVSTREDRSFYTYPGANRGLPALLGVPAVVADLAAARHVHFAMPLERSLAASIFPVLRQAGCTISIDVGFSPAWMGDLANLATCREVDFLLPNRKEAALLCGDDAPSAYVSWALAEGIERIVLKLGAEGALFADALGVHRVAPPAVDAVDTTGAGDAFDAGLIDALLDGDSLQGCVERACLCGALSTTAPGALQSLPHVSQLRTLREQTYGS